MVKSNLCIDVCQGGSLECQNQAVVVFPWLIEAAYAYSSFDDSQPKFSDVDCKEVGDGHRFFCLSRVLDIKQWFLYLLFLDHWKQSSLAQGSPHSNLHYDRTQQ